MFDGLQSKLSDIFDGLKKRGALKEADVDAALREIRVALLEADVALPVVKDFIDGVREKAVGQDVLRSVSPGQQVVKVVHDHLVTMLGGEMPDGLRIDGTPPVAFVMVGLQGSGKTTTSAKIALRLKNRDKKKVLLASLDVYRPAAQQQLQQLGQQIETTVLTPVFGEQPVAIAKLRRGDLGYRGPFAHRPGIDGRSAKNPRCRESVGNAFGDGCDDRPRRRQPGPRI